MSKLGTLGIVSSRRRWRSKVYGSKGRSLSLSVGAAGKDGPAAGPVGGVATAEGPCGVGAGIRGPSCGC